MEKLMRNYSAVFLMLMLLNSTVAKSNHNCGSEIDKKEIRVSKKLTFDFKAHPELTVQLSLKYAYVFMTSIPKDSVKVEAEIVAAGNNLAEANRILERVTLKYDYMPQRLNMRLEIAQEPTAAKKEESGGFGNIMNGLIQSFAPINEASKPAGVNIDQNNLKVVLKIHLPQTAFSAVENRYGNIELAGNFTGKITANLFHGDFKAEHLNAVQLDLSYGETLVRQLVKGTVNLRQGSFKSERGGELTLNSNGASVELDSVANLWLDSRNDRIVVKKAGKINGKTHFSDLEIRQLSTESNLEMQFGSLQIARMHPSLVTLDVMARATDIRLEQLPADTRYDLVVRPEKWQAPERLLRHERRPFEPAKGHVRIVWTEGNPKRNIAIENREGSVVMAVK